MNLPAQFQLHHFFNMIDSDTMSLEVTEFEHHVRQWWTLVTLGSMGFNNRFVCCSTFRARGTRLWEYGTHTAALYGEDARISQTKTTKPPRVPCSS